MKTNNTQAPYVITDLDRYRSLMSSDFYCFILLVCFDVAFCSYEITASWLCYIITLLFLLSFVINAIYYKRSRTAPKILLQIDKDGIYIDPKHQIAWESIKTVYLSGSKSRCDDFEPGWYLYYEKKDGSLKGVSLRWFRGYLDWFRLRSSLVYFSDGRADIKVQCPFRHG